MRAVVKPRLALDRFQAALSSMCFSCLDVRDALITLPSHAPSLAVPALARSASTLTGLQGLPIRGLSTRAGTGPTAFTRLRVLTLCQTVGLVERGLRAEYLPVSLEDLTLRLALDYCIIDTASSDEDTYEVHQGIRAPPVFVDFHSLCRLRRITFSRYDVWHLGTWDDEAKQLLPVQLPTSVSVRDCPLGGTAPRSCLTQPGPVHHACPHCVLTQGPVYCRHVRCPRADACPEVTIQRRSC